MGYTILWQEEQAGQYIAIFRDVIFKIVNTKYGLKHS